MTKFKINKNDHHQSIFKFLKKSFSNTPISVIYKWLRKGDVKINSKRIKNHNYLLKENDIVEVYDSNKPVLRDNFNYLKDVKLEICYEDQNLVIVNKPANLEMHSTYNPCLDDMVKSYLVDKKEYHPKKENSFVISHIHRLDKLTSGLVIYAKNKTSMDILTNAIKNKDQIEKYYYALVSDAWTLDAKLSLTGWIRYDSTIQKAIFSNRELPSYKNCKTEFNLIKNNLILVKLITGRKHQIRASLSYLKNPILNDFRYGGKKINDQKIIYLSASKLVFDNLEKPLDYLNKKTVELIPQWAK
ncbi:pseudouridine synthase [Mycoplasma putrefaciens]|uniref:RNA pseudouridylate synthase n=1 Tax=Mycoplasma putrefaciens (strain ATCC 15718 / NCTC 10155 / C30 KS-1 / KS-1) TaxID=743965 RepID=A0A7U3ZT28_MYCPK|nr:RluA family pseudouridine synthase [Mycoplasma putrefaciens]AEM68968.1 RNA pseudouridylate synthase family protein [Mycoplasma putrefaciens KS1]